MHHRRRRLIGLLGGSLAAAALPALGQAAGTRAQAAGRVYRIGFLGQRPLPWLVDPLVAQLRSHGWVAGRNLQMEVRATGGDPRRAVEMASAMVAQGIDVIVVAGTHMAIAARQVTAKVPIVMIVSGFPVAGGLVASYARPGGNVTGLAIYGGDLLFAKFMSLATELLPSLREIGVIWDYLPPAFLEKETEIGLGELRRAADLMKIKARVWMIHSEADLDAALAELEAAPVQALFATSGPVHGQPANVERINAFALRRRLPLICDIAGSVFQGGGLLSYSMSWGEAVERCASFVDRILRGANPAELPIELPRRFELVINRKIASAIGLAIPPALLMRADKVIE